MNFSEALELLKQGKKVGRICWGATGCYICFDESNALSEYVRIGDEWKEDDYIICKCDLLAQDWKEYKEPVLTKEEKEYLKMIIKFSPGEVDFVSLERLSSYKGYDYNIVWLVYRDGDRLAYYVGEDYFKNLKGNNEYTLEGLGLKD